jgi:DNA-binding NarL/FixJ family response regulator
VLTADDNGQFHRRVTSILAGIGGTEIVGQAGDVPGAIEVMKPNTVILDIQMPGIRQGKETLADRCHADSRPKSEYQTMSFLVGVEYFLKYQVI